MENPFWKATGWKENAEGHALEENTAKKQGTVNILNSALFL